ncbi:MAG: single-stranded-DNA-specific exonuclease RecJ [Candidatus Uhrbacteria bacterium]
MAISWTVLPSAPLEFLERFPELPDIIAHLLYHREVRTQEAIDAFLNPDYGTDLHDPFLFRDMERAVERIFRARDAGERIVVYGDFDADGVCGATVLLDTLEALGCLATAYLPHREREGYGLHAGAIDELVAQGTRLIVTCDCGISNAAEVARTHAVGVDVIVTDHHLVPTDPASGEPLLPAAYATLHPKLPGETYPYRDLTGGGVAFKFACGLVKRDASRSDRRLPEGFEKWLLDCAAIATVADFGPLIGENRTLVTYGLVVLQKTRRLGLRALYEVAGINPVKITPTTIGFQIAPRINAAGRLDHANEALALLRSTDSVAARSYAEKLNATNTERQRLVEAASIEAIAQVGDVGDRRVLVVIGKQWLPGIVGLVASRVREQFYRPTIALTHSDDKIVGSGRSIGGFNIVEALRFCAELLECFGGHPQACGLTLRDASILDAFREKFEAYARAHLTDEQLVPSLSVDAEIRLENINWELVELLGKLGPFGVGNPTPRYLARSVVVDSVQTMGNDGKHRKLLVHQGERKSQRYKMVCFRYENICPDVHVGDEVDVVVEVDVNEWNGNREIQLKMVDLRLTIV